MSVDAMEKKLTELRPYTRQEFQAALAGGKPDGMTEENYRANVFDFERSPHIERRGLNEARLIVLSTPREAYPDLEVYLFACLQRVESFLYECFKPEGLGWRGGDERSLMFKSGVRKVVRAVAERLPRKAAEVWAARRGALDDIQNEIWKSELGLASGADADRRLVASLTRMAETLLSISPAEMNEFGGAPDFIQWLEKLS